MIAQALACCVSCNLPTIPTELHAAPAPRSFLASVLEMQHALSTLADPISIGMGEQRCRAVRQWGIQVFGLARREPHFRRGSPPLLPLA